jgi:hypothetical protein
VKHLVRSLFVLALLLSSQALAVPGTVAFTGRLRTSQGPVTGTVDATFTLYTAASGGTSVWTEARNGLSAVDGLLYVDLGAVTPLDENIFNGDVLYLEIEISGETLTPRAPIRSVPYAIRAGVANSADTLGPLTPDDVLTDVTASGGLTATHTGTVVHITGTPITGVAPIAVNAGAVSLTTCAAGQIYKMVGASWACATDDGTTSVVPNGGITINPNLQIGLTTCAIGQVLKSTGAGTWGCAVDNDTATTYGTVTNGGLVLSGNNFGLAACAAGQVLQSNGAGSWSCVNVSTLVMSSFTTQTFSCTRFSSISGNGTSNCAISGTWDACMLSGTQGIDSDDVDGFGCTISGNGSSWTLSAFGQDFTSTTCAARCIRF